MPLSTFFALTFATAAWLKNPSPQDVPAKPDRSAETELREVFRVMGSLRMARISIVRYEMENESDRVSESAWFEIWYRGPGEFRAESTEVMGGQGLFVSDGRSMLRWGGGETMRLVDAPALLADSGMDVRSSASFLCLLLDGEDRFSKLVSESGRIVELARSEEREVIEFVAPNIGTVRLGFDPGTKVAMSAMIVRPRSGGSPFGGARVTLDRVVRIERGLKFPDRLITTQAPAGFTVEDQRKTKPKGTGHAAASVAN
ncbi:MAG: hypothetical protein KF884_01085 [Fimbriimonadaceae bacterium]|nr:hypothetical protein [Fimbriimonadaceae bacterium]QYK58690.1 MAG: hypothetical protein KF884_01085 [Fimbriimonadaceae bacterium]